MGPRSAVYPLPLPLGLIDPLGEFQSAAAVAEMARALEAAGLDAGYITDHPAPDTNWLHANGHDALDPFTAQPVPCTLTVPAIG